MNFLFHKRETGDGPRPRARLLKANYTNGAVSKPKSKSNHSCSWQEQNNMRLDEECHIAKTTALEAVENHVTIISRQLTISFMRQCVRNRVRSSSFLDIGQWTQRHPTPRCIHGLSVGMGIQIAASLLPKGGSIKMVGCDGGAASDPRKPHPDLPKLSRSMKGIGAFLRTAGPGWELVNCNRRSNYVKFT